MLSTDGRLDTWNLLFIYYLILFTVILHLLALYGLFGSALSPHSFLAYIYVGQECMQCIPLKGAVFLIKLRYSFENFMFTNTAYRRRNVDVLFTPLLDIASKVRQQEIP